MQFSNPPAIPMLTVGNRVMTDLANLIVLVGNCTSSNKTTMRLRNGTAGYQVPASRTLRLVAWRMNVGTAASLPATGLLYSDNDVGVSTATAYTNPVYQGGAVGVNANLTSLTTGATGLEGALNFTIPTGKYPGYWNNGTAAEVVVTFYGYLE